MGTFVLFIVWGFFAWYGIRHIQEVAALCKEGKTISVPSTERQIQHAKTQDVCRVTYETEVEGVRIATLKSEPAEACSFVTHSDLTITYLPRNPAIYQQGITNPLTLPYEIGSLGFIGLVSFTCLLIFGVASWPENPRAIQK